MLFSQVPIPRGIVERNLNSGLEKVNFSHNVMKKWHNFDSAILIALELEESWCGEKLLAFARKSGGHVDELIIVDSLSSIVWLRHILFQQVPEFLKVLLFQDLTGLILKESSPCLLSDPMKQRIFFLLWLLEEEFWDCLVWGVLFLLKSFLLF